MAPELELGPLRLGVIGAGRLGRVLAGALARAGLELVAVSSRSEQGRSAAAQALEVPAFEDPQQVLQGVDLLLLCVPDDEVAPLGTLLAAALAGREERPRVVHTSGIVPLAALDPLYVLGCPVLSVHPLQTVTDEATPRDLHGAPAAVVAHDEPERVFGRALAHAVGMVPFDLADDQRPLYHAAASMAANFTVTLQAAVRDVARQADLHESVVEHAFTALARAALDRVERDGPRRALTGPVTRGDVGTVAMHLHALDQHAPGAATLYRPLAHATTRLALAAGRIDVATAARIDGAISEGRTD